MIPWESTPPSSRPTHSAPLPHSVKERYVGLPGCYLVPPFVFYNIRDCDTWHSLEGYMVKGEDLEEGYRCTGSS